MPPLGPLIVGGGAMLGLGLGALILNNQKKGPPADVPPLPEDLIGSNPRQAGNRSNTDIPGINPTPEKLFDKLTGGRSETLPDGTRKGPNNIRLSRMWERDRVLTFRPMVKSLTKQFISLDRSHE